MKIVLALAGLLTAAGIAADSAGEDIEGGDAGMVDTESWRRLGNAAWRFDTFGLEAGPEAVTSFLVSPDVHTDFRLTVEFWIEDDTNSGVFVRCGEIAGVDDVNPTDCYEVNIYDSHPNQTWRTGSIVTQVTPAAHVETLSRWNRLEIRAAGSHLEVFVNGTLTAELTDARAGAGPIALQYAGRGLVRFRKLSIVAL
ncbi:MAG TPA: DUF1080 domain-containing protein [Woeseiaceae bacterium]|nr:DUF1080 domain-containing protein [Woeseiaceae bacterium]